MIRHKNQTSVKEVLNYREAQQKKKTPRQLPDVEKEARTHKLLLRGRLGNNCCQSVFKRGRNRTTINKLTGENQEI